MADRRLVPLLALLIGAGLYLMLASGILLNDGVALVGTKIYDYYFLALIEGRFDVPPRVATLEGHYDADGRAYVYYGLAPLITRLLAWPFVDLADADLLSNLTVWIFALAGTLPYHLTMMRAIDRYGPETGAMRRAWQAIAAVMVWICAPGLVLSANHAVFHEPFSVAFFCVGWSLFFHARVALFGTRPGAVILPLAIFAGIAVFARPHVAVGLYLGTGLMMLAHLRANRMAALPRLVAVAAVLGLFGAGLLGFNAARFGNPLQMSGSNEAGAVEYGFSYWGLNSPQNDARLAAFAEHGTFNLRRIPPNMLLYAADIPWGHLTGDSMRNEGGPIDTWYRSATADLGFIRVEAPRMGFIYLWAPWLVLAAGGFLRRPTGPPYGLAGLAATAVIAAFILSYGTVTLRYRLEVFPLIAWCAILAMPRVLAWQGQAGSRGRAGLGLLGAAAGAAALVSLVTAAVYSDAFRQVEPVSYWSFETCRDFAREKGFPESEVPRLCRL